MQRIWDIHEDLMGLKHNWYHVSLAEQDPLPEERKFDEMSEGMDGRGWENGALVEALSIARSKYRSWDRHSHHGGGLVLS